MVLVGTSGAAYLSHIPMFRRPHDVQLIAAVRLTHADWKGSQDFSKRLHTFVPAKFDLTALMEGKVKTLDGAIHEGNFEAGGKQLWEHVKVEVVSLLRSTVLTGDAPSSQGMKLFVFGEPGRTFAAHVIGHRPSHDQIVVVKPKGFSDRALSKGVELVLADVRESSRLRKGDVVSGIVAGSPATLTILEELSFLRGPDFVPEPSGP